VEGTADGTGCTGHSPQVPEPQDDTECRSLMHNTETPEGSHPQPCWQRHMIHNSAHPPYRPRHSVTNVLPVHTHHVAWTLHLLTSTWMDHLRSLNKNTYDVLTEQKSMVVNTEPWFLPHRNWKGGTWLNKHLNHSGDCMEKECLATLLVLLHADVDVINMSVTHPWKLLM
jgi:hypothetical protein